MKVLTGENVNLRALEPTDLDTLYDWENDLEVWRVSSTLTPYSKHVLEQYLQAQHEDIFTIKQLRLMICDADQCPVGSIELFDFDPFNLRAGVGILIGTEEDKRKGFAAEALGLLVEYCTDILHLHQLYCNIAEDNEASLSLFEKAGFEKVGMKKDWLNRGDGFVGEYLLQRLA